MSGPYVLLKMNLGQSSAANRALSIRLRFPRESIKNGDNSPIHDC